MDLFGKSPPRNFFKIFNVIFTSFTFEISVLSEIDVKMATCMFVYIKSVQQEMNAKASNINRYRGNANSPYCVFDREQCDCINACEM